MAAHLVSLEYSALVNVNVFSPSGEIDESEDAEEGTGESSEGRRLQNLQNIQAD